jgi:tRNA G18 (ribose-2'-O)-methylase SpoU
VPVYKRTRAEIEALCGFHFHRGLLVSADCPVLPDVLEALPPGPAPLLVLPEINDPENLGSLLRTAAAFGVAGVLLGERCSTPFSRRVLRVSMGAALELPLVHTRNLRAELERLRGLGLVLLGSSARRGLPPAELELADTAPRALLLGNEGQGLAGEYAELCHTLLRIPLGPAVSSLNVALAAGILLYELTGRGRHVSGARP